MADIHWVRQIANHAPGFRLLVAGLTEEMQNRAVYVEQEQQHMREKPKVKRKPEMRSRVDSLPVAQRAIYQKVAPHVGMSQKIELLEMYERQVRRCQSSS